MRLTSGLVSMSLASEPSQLRQTAGHPQGPTSQPPPLFPEMRRLSVSYLGPSLQESASLTLTRHGSSTSSSAHRSPGWRKAPRSVGTSVGWPVSLLPSGAASEGPVNLPWVEHPEIILREQQTPEASAPRAPEMAARKGGSGGHTWQSPWNSGPNWSRQQCRGPKAQAHITRQWQDSCRTAGCRYSFPEIGSAHPKGQRNSHPLWTLHMSVMNCSSHMKRCFKLQALSSFLS